jgi:hypothetical protein
MKRVHLLVALLLSTFLPGRSETIIDTGFVTGFYGVSSSQSVAISWTLSSNFHDVTISAPISLVNIGTPQPGVAYLASSAPTASIQSSPFLFPVTALAGLSFEPSYVDLFQNLTLTAGTYYLTLMPGSPTSAGGWAMSGSFPGQTAEGVSVGQTYLGNPSNRPFLGSSSSFFDTSNFGRAGLRISGVAGDDLTGDPVVTTTPEPPTYALFFGLSLVGLAFTRRRVSLHSL